MRRPSPSCYAPPPAEPTARSRHLPLDGGFRAYRVSKDKKGPGGGIVIRQKGDYVSEDAWIAARGCAGRCHDTDCRERRHCRRQDGDGHRHVHAPTATTAATSQANEIVIGVVSTAGQNMPFAEDPHFTEIASFSTANFYMAYRVVSATGAQTYAPTTSGSGGGGWQVAVATYKTQ
jgi:hypothetical protein